MKTRNRKSGFTLVEILIVVIILGILAAIVIPQFTEASSDARESSLTSNLQTLRSQLGLYKVQHLDQYPSEGGATPAEFETRLITKTNADHTAGGDFGPYMQAVPTNPFNGLNTVRIDATAADATAGANTDGWVFNAETGAIQADDNLSNSEGTAHIEL